MWWNQRREEARSWKPKLSETKTNWKIRKVQGEQDKSNKDKNWNRSKKQIKSPTLKDKEKINAESKKS
ncbi:hypothetical protein HYE02_03815 [Mycoplasmopsis bovis]|nr:hypothetical protein [Mycoplasmopsis bovis]QQH28187.1 hypothetical protein HYE02_03815 [Mycoplasmopsis bovis]